MQEKIEQMQDVNKSYGDKLDRLIREAVEQFLSEKPNEDIFLVAIAGMKEVRDVLRGAIIATSEDTARPVHEEIVDHPSLTPGLRN